MGTMPAEPHIGARLLDRGGVDLDADPVLKVRELQLSYGSGPLLHVAGMEIRASEVVAIVGRSGCGKTTLLTCLSGDMEPAAGTYILAGAERGRGLRNTFVSRTLQAFPLLHWLTVQGNLALAARVRGVRKPDFKRILASFSAEGLSNRFPAGLSGGERCRASLSQALLGDPKLLLLDEPFTGLDTLVKQIVARNLFRLARASGAGIIFVTHDLNDALEFSDRVIALGSHGPAVIVGEVSPTSPSAMEELRRLLGGDQ